MKEPFFKKNNISLFLSEWEERKDKYKYNHSLIFPINTYSPWLEDSFYSFYLIYVKPYTLVDIYRCFDLYNLSFQMLNLRGDIIEIGVWRGGTAKILEKNIGVGNSLFLCDTFTGVVKASEYDNIYKGGEHADTSFEMVNNLFYNNKNVIILKGVFPEETSHLISDHVFKFCHIDVDVYNSAKDIYAWIFPKVVIGGIIVFDDYGFASCEGITSFVNELIQDIRIRIIYNTNGHAILVKIMN